MQQKPQIDKIFIGSDHAGIILKETLIKYIKDILKLQLEDIGTYSKDSCDYPDFAAKVSQNVAITNNTFGVIVCGSGIGVSMSANKVKGVRCVVCHDDFTARVARTRMNANVITFGERVTGNEVAQQALKTFLEQSFDSNDENLKLLLQLEQLEQENLV